MLLGSAENGNGILRLLKALRHEVPFVAETAKRLKVENAKSAAYVMKTLYTGHGGKLSRRARADGRARRQRDRRPAANGADERIAGVFTREGRGAGQARRPPRPATRSRSGASSASSPARRSPPSKDGIVQIKGPGAPEPVLASSIGLKDRKDEVKLSAALGKLIEEDPSLVLEHNQDTHQVLLKGQGEMHLRVAFERLQRKYGVTVERQKRHVPYKETIRKGIEIRGRHKKQSGGHGQFGDVVLEHPAAARGAGFAFGDNDHRRRGAEAVHPVGRDRRRRLPEVGPARLPGGRRRR